MRFATSWNRPTLSHTSLFLILSLRVTLAILLKQDISNTRNLFSCVCFKVQVSELYINTLSTIVSYTCNFVVLLMSVDDHTFFNIWNTVLANPVLLLNHRPLNRGYRRYHPGKQNCQSVAAAVHLCISENCYYHD